MATRVSEKGGEAKSGQNEGKDHSWGGIFSGIPDPRGNWSQGASYPIPEAGGQVADIKKIASQVGIKCTR